jgi:hypothetical protein
MAFGTNDENLVVWVPAPGGSPPVILEIKRRVDERDFTLVCGSNSGGVP